MTSTAPKTREVFYASGPDGKIVKKMAIPDGERPNAFYEMLEWAHTMEETELEGAPLENVENAALTLFADRFNYSDWMLYLTYGDQVSAVHMCEISSDV
jgi:hypothetical protein